MFMVFVIFKWFCVKVAAYLEPSAASATVHAPVLSWAYVWERDKLAGDARGAIHAILNLRLAYLPFLALFEGCVVFLSSPLRIQGD